MKKSVLIILSFLCSFIAKGQLYDAQWALGDNESVLDFRATDTVSAYIVPTFEYFTFTNASICDESGNLLYYTNGISICGVNDTLLNGSGLNPCAYTEDYAQDGLNIDQAGLFIPQPGNSEYYYLFHFSNDLPDSTLPGTLYYTQIRDSGLGIVEKKNVPFGKGIFRQGGMTACKHANGRDYWIIMGLHDSNEYFKYLFTPDSIFGPFVQDIGPIFSGYYDLAYSNFSQDGSKYATGIFGGAPILVMDFDRCSGEFSNPITINEIAGAFPNQDTILGCQSLEFSPNGEFLYVSNPYNLDQFDLWSSNVQDSIEIYQGNYRDTGAAYYGIDMLQTAPNGKLYGSTWNGGLGAVHVVNYPDLKGDSSDFVYGGQSSLTQNTMNLPNLINYKLGPLVGSGCDTIKTVGVNNVAENNVLRIMPNPADKYVYVEMGMQGNYEFDLLNEVGQVIDRKATRQVDIFDTENLASGVYFLRVMDKNSLNKIAVQKVVIQH